MTAGRNGGFIGVNAPVGPTGGSGVWSIEDANLLTQSNQWPSYTHAISGGTTTDITTGGLNYRVHTFTAPGTLTISGVGYGLPTVMEYVVIGGGGGSYRNVGPYGVWSSGGGGGGAGGYKIGTIPTMVVGTYPITVGTGGAASANGNPSTLTWPAPGGGPFVATGGGYGGRSSPGSASPTVQPGAPGGSGGGAGGLGPPTTASATGGTGTPGQGNPGGNGYYIATPTPAPTVYSAGGGGGGATSAGIAGAGPTLTTPSTRGRGGAGIANSISNTSITYSVGGHGEGAALVATPALVISTSKGSGGNGFNPANAPSAGPTSGLDGTVIIRYRLL